MTRDIGPLSPARGVRRRWALLAGLVVCALAGAVAAKPGTPGPAWFEGVFERVGRSGGAEAILLNDRMRVVAEGQTLAFRACDGRSLARMGFGPAFEIENLLSGRTGGGSAMDCLFNSDGLGRPLMTCRAADGTVFTLFSLPPGTEGCKG